MGFFANIIQDSRRAITTDVRVPTVISAPNFSPVADEGVSETIPSPDGPQTFEGSELRSQPEMPLEANSGLKTKRDRPQSSTIPKQPQAVQQEIDPSPDVIQASIVAPKSMSRPRGQSIDNAPLKETRTFKTETENNTTQPQDKVNSNLVRSTSTGSVHKDGIPLPIRREQRDMRSSEPRKESGVEPNTARSPKSNGAFIGALKTNEQMPRQDLDVVNDAQEMSVVEASDVRPASIAVPVSAMPGRSSQDKPDAKHSERAAVANSTHVQIGQVNIIVEGPSDSKRQPVKLPSSNDLASRTFLRSL